MSSKVRFPELNDLLVETGLSINALSGYTGVSRNTLSAMRDNKEISTNSVAKLLNGLKGKRNFDVRKFSAILQDRIAQERTRKAVANSGPNLVLLDNEPARTPVLIAADLSERLKQCAGLASELAEALNKEGTDVQEQDARDIERFHTHLNADLGEVYVTLCKPLISKEKKRSTFE